MDWKAILESPIIQRQSYVSWEDYIRRLASESGHPSEGSIYTMFAYDEKYEQGKKSYVYFFNP